MKALKAMKKFFKYSAVLGVLLFPIYGCSDLNETGTSVTLFGKVVDVSTRTGVGDVKVYLKVNGEWRSTTTETGSDVVTAQSKTGIGAAESSAGDFKFSGLPRTTSSGTFSMIIQPTTASGYMQKNANVTTVGPTAEAGDYSIDAGQVTVEKGRTATIYVVDADTGAAVPGATPYWARGGGNAGSFEDVQATVDATTTNMYTIVIPQTSSTSIVVPASDSNADGTYDYTANSVTFTSGDTDLTKTVSVSQIGPSTSLSLVASNFKVAGSDSGGGSSFNTMGASDNITLVYNLPVTLQTVGEDSWKMTYSDNFKNLSATAVNAEQLITASASGSVVTIAPVDINGDAASLTDNQIYTLEGTLVATIDPGSADTVTPASYAVRVDPTGTGSVGSTPTVTVDNFNCWSNGSVLVSVDTQAEANAQPYLVFPEPVWGTVRLNSTTVGTTTTISTNSPVAITGQNSIVYHVQEDCSTTAGFNSVIGGDFATGSYFRWSLAALGIGFTADDQTGAERNWNLAIDVYDSQGNTYSVEKFFISN